MGWRYLVSSKNNVGYSNEKTTTYITLNSLLAFSQTSKQAMEKLKNIKQLLDMDLITKSEFDSISNKKIILSNKDLE